MQDAQVGDGARAFMRDGDYMIPLQVARPYFFGAPHALPPVATHAEPLTQLTLILLAEIFGPIVSTQFIAALRSL